MKTGCAIYHETEGSNSLVSFNHSDKIKILLFRNEKKAIFAAVGDY